jgi:C1A family cysteine protease
MSKYAYGWRKDQPDPRDHLFALTREEQTTVLPSEFSLRAKMPPVYDQGQLGSCTANAIGGCVQYEQMKQKEAEGTHTPSRLFIYYAERAMEGTVDADSGAMIRDGMKVIATIGSPPETDWPYDIAKFKQKPPAQAFSDALKYEATYGRVTQSAHSLQASVYFKRPVVFGFVVYESFETIGPDGIMPMPNINTEQVMGGHATVVVGYKQINGHLYFEVRNSWSSSWGDSGYFWAPAAFMISGDFCNDFWHVNLTT